MSFSSELKEKLVLEPIKLNCCRKAFLLGLLFNASVNDENIARAEFSVLSAAQTAEALLGENSESRIFTEAHGGHKVYVLEFLSKSVYSFLAKLNLGYEISEAGKFRCNECRKYFLKGVLISCATINTPQKGYHLEISLSKINSQRADALENFLTANNFQPKRIEREKKTALYYKSNLMIFDVLNYAGAVKAGGDYISHFIIKEYANYENRATNLVAKNISKTVNATIKQINAINKLIERNMLDSLGEEVAATAMLRLENDDISLSELAMLHNPPISKSGLGHRLDKICRAADELDDE